MRKILIIGLLLCTTGLLNGQSGIFDEFVFSLWPEYDRPGILVIISGKVHDEHLPKTLEFRVPSETEKVLATGIVDTMGTLGSVPIENRGQEKWVSLNLASSDFHIEFYYDPFTDDHIKQVTYDLQFSHDIPEYMFAIQKPIMAENFTLPESDMESFQDQHGITFYRKLMPPLPASELYQVVFSYENHTGETSIEQLRKIMADQGPGGGMPGMPPAALLADKRHRMPLIEPLVTLALVAVVIGFLFYRQKKSESVPPKSDSIKGRFCTECGQTVKPDDKFCAKCGTKLNVPDSV
ncbi:MAG: zinc ribbon domain-containing protein [Candidatus Marinimicrobia bacterium]|nr:zinc ribbon domain-containing protein [Candidatus Neomarinimicrobiota bacterium]